MNEVRLSGKVLNAYLNDNGHFVCTLGVVHDHIVDGFNHGKESIFRCFLADKAKSALIDIKKGDKALVTGYLSQDMRLSNTGQERKHVNIYIKDIELSAKARGFGSASYGERG